MKPAIVALAVTLACLGAARAAEPVTPNIVFILADDRGIRRAMAYVHPFLVEKQTWPLKPDVQAWEGWPARQPSLLFAGMALGERRYLELWRKLSADPVDPEVQRNIAVTQPLLWLPERP